MIKSATLFLRSHYIFIAILLIALFLRLYRIQDLTTFGRDQGIDFLTVREMVLFHKWTLIGIKTSIGEFFQGPVYLYMLYPSFLLLKLNPIAGPLTAVIVSFFTLCVVYVTGIKFFSKNAALISSSLFAVSPLFVMYGNSPLYQHFLPLFIVLSIFLFLYLEKKKKISIAFFLGVSVGIGIELHLLNIILAVSLFLVVVVKKYGLKVISGYLFGILFGVSPTILFEIRHQFLNTHLFLGQFQGGSSHGLSLLAIPHQMINGASMFLGGGIPVVGAFILIISIIFLLFIKNKKDKSLINLRDLLIITFIVSVVMTVKFSAFEPHYLLPLWILLLVFLPVCLENLPVKNVRKVIVILLLFVGLQTTIKGLMNDHGYNMPDGWTMKKIKTTAEIISKDVVGRNNFNVASLLDGDTRAYPLRYTVEVNGKIPMRVDEYPKTDTLYVVSGNDKRILSPDVWEISSMGPLDVIRKWDLGQGIYLYKLRRVARKID